MEFHAFLAKGVVIFFAILAGMFGGAPYLASDSGSSTATSTQSTSSLSILTQNGTGFFIPSLFGLKNIASSTSVLPFSLPHSVSTSSSSGGSSVVPPVVIPVPVPPAATTTEGTIEITPTQPAIIDAGIAEVEDAIVNILCTSKETGLKSISGSGSIIDSRGLILTAAHVGQYFLLERASSGADVSCVIRMGDPAKTLYKATPIYVSQGWITSNPTAITQAMATGNGKNDYAVLAITQSTTGGNLPATFPSLSLSSVTPEKGDSIIIGTYGAEFLTSEQIRTALSPTIVETEIQKLYTLQITPVDLLSLGASAAAQSGSSGGVVVDAGKVIGVVTTSSLGTDRSTRDLRAITIGHIRKSYEKETNGSFDLDFRASVMSLIQRFAATEQSLADTLNEAIDAQ